MKTNPPRIAVTSGEPAGIGPDLCLALAQHQLPCQVIVIGSLSLLAERAEMLDLSVKLTPFDSHINSRSHPAGELLVLATDLIEPAVAGTLNTANSRYVIKTITKAVHGCKNGLFDAMVTAPVHKAVINDAGYNFSGHTEFIAELTGGTPVMMLATPGLRVALVTIHLPLAAVPKAITHSTLRKTLVILDQALKQHFGIAQPCILVCGLNPHAGENGYLGREEIDVITPVIANLRGQGFCIEGPLPADTLFTPKYLTRADAVVAMYHDQGLPVLKHMGFGKAANITLGLPIIRTSVDHGTALALAGSGQADSGSLQYALEVALQMIDNKYD